MSENESGRSDAPPEELRQRRRRGRAIARWVKRVIMIAVAAALVAAIVVAYIPAPVEVDLAVVEEGRFRVDVREDGKTRVANRYILSAPLVGNMDRITLQPGDQVKEGGLLLRIVPAASPLLDRRSRAEAEARVSAAIASQRRSGAEVERVRTAFQRAERDLQKQRELASAGVAAADGVEQAEFSRRASREELRAAVFAVKVAARNTESARAALGIWDRAGNEIEGIDITAPVSGKVLRIIHRDAQGLVQPGTPLLEIGELASMEIVVDVLTADAVRMQQGAKTRIVRWGGDDALVGHVHRIEPSAFTRISALGVEEQRVNVVVYLDSPRQDWESLGDGYRVEVDITVWQGDGVVSVPASSVFRHEDRWAVYMAVDGVARLRSVETGERTDTRVQILSGAQAGEAVIVHPSDRVADGVEIAPRKS